MIFVIIVVISTIIIVVIIGHCLLSLPICQCCYNIQWGVVLWVPYSHQCNRCTTATVVNFAPVLKSVYHDVDSLLCPPKTCKKIHIGANIYLANLKIFVKITDVIPQCDHFDSFTLKVNRKSAKLKMSCKTLCICIIRTNIALLVINFMWTKNMICTGNHLLEKSITKKKETNTFNIHSSGLGLVWRPSIIFPAMNATQ